jgi:glycerol-3-phosphate dehydrogenase
VTGINIQDNLNGKTYSAAGKIVVNATGHWADLLWQQFQIKSPAALRKTRGIHLVVKKLTGQALVLFAKSDGRLFFLIPWGEFSLIGTTDTDYRGDPDNVYASAADVEYLVMETARYFPGFDQSRILYTIAGLRPLVCQENISASATSRAHRIVDHAKEGISGLISVLGGKITAQRGIAQETVDLVCRKLGNTTECTTDRTALPGAAPITDREIKAAAAEYQLPAATVRHLITLYGSQFKAVLELIRIEPHLAAPLYDGAPDILAQVKWAVENEEALTVSDFMLRRSIMGYAADRGIPALESVSREMAELLGWTDSDRMRQVEEFVEYCRLGQRWKGE